jgi:hypothetical protein
MQEPEVIHDLGGIEQDGLQFHHAAQNGTCFATCELFISGIVGLTFLDCAETTGSKIANNRDYHIHNLPC